MGEQRNNRRGLIPVGVIAVVAAAFAVWWFSPDQQQRRRNAALFAAVKAGDIKATEAALDGGADVNARDDGESTPLMHAARGDRPEYENPAPTDHPEVVELLIRRGAEVNGRTSTGHVALFWASKYGHVKVVRVLLTHGADVNAKDDYGETALAGAGRHKHGDVIALLKQAGAKE